MISIKDQSKYGNKITTSQENGKSVYSFKYPCSSYSVCSPIEIEFHPGLYFLECWGASGTFMTHNNLVGKGGKGGYSSGVFITKRKRRLFLYIGGSKNQTHGSTTLDESFNGSPGGSNDLDGVGGGATDFRTKSGRWNENPSSRIIVAGGGGSGRIHTYSGNKQYTGGDGGGLSGTAGQGLNCSSPYGTQTDSVGSCSSVSFWKGTFGSGAGGGWAGGGGGWWGGGSVYNGAGGGGSGYIGNLDSIGKYVATTKTFDYHIGSGQAKITIMSDIPESLKCSTLFRRSSINHFSSILK